MRERESALWARILKRIVSLLNPRLEWIEADKAASIPRRPRIVKHYELSPPQYDLLEPGELGELNRAARAFRCKPDASLPGVTVVWRGSEQVGSFEWAPGARARSVGEVLGRGMSCARHPLNWFGVVVRSAHDGRPSVASAAPLYFERALRDRDGRRFRWYRDDLTGWYWVTDRRRGGLISFRRDRAEMIERTQLSAKADLDVWVAKDLLEDPAIPYLIGFGWFMLSEPIAGLPFWPRRLLLPGWATS